jgi:uncharacterized membrane protein YvbJ
MDENSAANSICPACHASVNNSYQFCPTCGKLLREATIGKGKQFYIYIVSLLFPPFGFIWTWRYFRSNSSQKKRIAYISLVLTIISVIASIWFTNLFLQSLQKQMMQYNNLGI